MEQRIVIAGEVRQGASFLKNSLAIVGVTLNLGPSCQLPSS